MQNRLSLLGRCRVFFAAVFCLAWLVPVVMTAQPAESTEILLMRASESYEKGDEVQAMRIYQNILQREPGNYDALWNASLLYTRRGHYQPTEMQKRNYFTRARELGVLCLEIYPEKPRCHYVYGISTATLVDIMPNSAERIQLIWDIRKHAERAAELDPNYAPVWHLLGIWNSKLANTSRAERVGARMLYGRLPEDASHAKAEEYLKKAIRLEPNEILFHVDLAQHYIASGQQAKAKPILERVLAMNMVSDSDRFYMIEARQNLNELQ
jgi:tetratricopeptide (TPR) repeat protein